MSNFLELQAALDEFNKDYPRPYMDCLVLSAEYNIKTDFESLYPGTGLPGVYAIFDSNGELLRIGKASCSNTIDSRLSAYFKWHHTDYIDIHRHKGYENATTIRTISFPIERAFEASALEEYLIGKLNPQYNTVGRKNS